MRPNQLKIWVGHSTGCWSRDTNVNTGILNVNDSVHTIMRTYLMHKAARVTQATLNANLNPLEVGIHKPTCIRHPYIFGTAVLSCKHFFRNICNRYARWNAQLSQHIVIGRSFPYIQAATKEQRSFGTLQLPAFALCSACPDLNKPTRYICKNGDTAEILQQTAKACPGFIHHARELLPVVRGPTFAANGGSAENAAGLNAPSTCTVQPAG